MNLFNWNSTFLICINCFMQNFLKILNFGGNSRLKK